MRNNSFPISLNLKFLIKAINNFIILGTLTLLAGIIVFVIGIFFTIWGLAFIEFQGGYNITNSAMPTGIVVLFAAILILRKYKRDKQH